MNQNLLLKYISGKASQREKEEVAAWIDADAANLKEFMSLRKSYDALVWQDADELKTGRASAGSMPIAIAGSESVSKLIKSRCTGANGTGSLQVKYTVPPESLPYCRTAKTK